MYDRPNMRRTLLLLVTAAGIAAAQQVVQFKDHVIEANAKGGYAVIVTDINKDGKPDVIGISQQLPDLTWYENPGLFAIRRPTAAQFGGSQPVERSSPNYGDNIVGKSASWQIS